jgi:hypothetical protein
MKPRRTVLLGLGLALLCSAALLADDLRGHDAFVCAVLEVSRCHPGEGCDEIQPADANIPAFIEVDLAAKALRTTAASAERRATPILSVTRQDGELILQGVEQGRAWSFVIDEPNGTLSAAVAREEFTVTSFATCTPLTASHP